jgi:hypothetical protein
MPFLRASKGTVQRRVTISAYQAKIENLYEDASLNTGQDLLTLDFQSEADLARSITALTERELDMKALDLTPTSSSKVLTLCKL